MIQMLMNVQSTHAVTTGDALTLMVTTFAYVNQDGRPKTVPLVVKEILFLELSGKNFKILLVADFQVFK